MENRSKMVIIVVDASAYKLALPNLLEDIRALIDHQTQTDPSFKSTRLYTRMSASEVRRQLIEQKGYKEFRIAQCRNHSTSLK